MTTPPRREPPTFTGVTIHRDPRGRFAVRYPSDWQTVEIRDGEPAAEGEPAAREGIGCAPDARAPYTALTVWTSPLEESVVAEDLDDLRAGVDEGLRALEDCTVESGSELVLGNLLRFERVYTFRERLQPDDPGTVRKRKQWLLYVDRWLMCLTWQGSNEEAYRHWFAMANQSFLTFEIPEALWFATDRDLAGLRASSTPGAAPTT